MLGAIFFKAQNKIQDPAKLSRLVQLIDAESWISLDADTKGDLYEGLLQKNAEDTKSGAGQYFTPRALIEAMVACVRPEPMKAIADPACGTGGFFLGAYSWLTRPGTTLDKRQKAFLRDQTFHGNEIVPGTRRMCLMNLFLHNIGELDGEPSVERSDALITEPRRKVDYVLANPPFGKKSSMTFTNEEGEDDKDALIYERQDFWTTTSNKQLNFLQHIKTLLKTHGRAAVVLPDNVLFEGGAGETIRKKLLHECDVHTLLRLPTGLFYAQGVKANVLFFEKKGASETPWTKQLWIYDLRTNKHFTLKTNPLTRADLDEFVALYQVGNRHQRQATWSPENPEGRWRAYGYDELVARDKTSLDIFWLKDDSLADSDNLPAPGVIAQEIVEDLQAALEQFKLIAGDLGEVVEE